MTTPRILAVLPLLALSCLVGPSLVRGQSAAELDGQIADLDGVIETVSTLQALQESVHAVKEHVRITDVIEQYSGDQAGGLGFELRQMRDLLVKLDTKFEADPEGGPLRGQSERTAMSGAVDFGRKVHSALSAVDAALALGAGTQATGPERLRLMAQYIGALNDAIGVLSLEVNPVIDATLGVYAKALESAADVAEKVIEPRTAAVNEAIEAAGDALGSEDGASDEFGDLLDELYEMRADLKRRRAELETQNVDYLAAQGNCLRTLGLDYGEVIDRENDVERTRHELMDIAEDLAEAERTITGAEMAILDLESELANAQDRRRRGDISAPEPSTIQARIDAETNNIRYAREKIRRLQDELRNAAPDYEAKLQAAMSFKDCIRSLLAQYAEQALDEQPI
ncbi:MAG TPA: hypothetical protein VJ982_03340, partial [Gemmatimonadota bacterium]|nr:hypothetical protein [Gemmatimonadota bacterium]